MTDSKKPRYANSYSLITFIQTLQNIPRRYNPRDYYGGCLRMQENRVALFLDNFINDDIVVLPEHYDLLENLLFVLRSSGYRPIKKLLPYAKKKYNLMKNILHEHQIAANSVKPVLTQSGADKYTILDNKKKMLLMSCSDLCAMGDAVNSEKIINTTKIRNKFLAFVTYRIELVLSGKMAIYPDFNVLLNKYGTSYQKKLYEKILLNQVPSYTPVQMQPINKPQPNTQSKPKLRPAAKPKIQPVQQKKHPQPAPQPDQPKEKKSGIGFFKKIGQKTKKVFDKVKKPLLVTGILALSIFGGKRAYDAAVEQNAETVKTETTVNKPTVTKKAPMLNVSDSLRVNNVQSVVNSKTTATPTNQVMKKTVAQLQNLKATNPTDRNMDVTKTTNCLYQKFGNNASNVVLACAMTPYALNDYTKFDIRPTTHNMIEYLCTHDLTPAQSNALDKFIATHVKNNSINMNDFATYNANLLRQNQR